MSWRLLVCAVLAIWLTGSCARPQLGGIMKQSEERPHPQKTLQRTDWTTAERVVVFVHSPTAPLASGVMGPDYSWVKTAGKVAGGAAMGAAGLPAVQGAGLLAATLISLLIPDPKDRSKEFQGQVRGKLGADYFTKFSQKMERIIKARAQGQVMLVVGSPENQGEIQWNPSDSAIDVYLYLMFTGDKPVMTAQLHWGVVVQGENLPEVRKNMEKKLKALEDKQARGPEWQAIYNSYDGYGLLTYTSPPHSIKEWLADDGELLLEEWHNAVAQLSEELKKALAGGNPS